MKASTYSVKCISFSSTKQCFKSDIIGSISVLKVLHKILKLNNVINIYIDIIHYIIFMYISEYYLHNEYKFEQWQNALNIK